MNPASEEEITDSLIDTERNVIWRKVARREHIQLVRGLRAIVRLLYPATGN